MNSRVWFTICLFFFIFYFKLLFDDKYLINYIIVENEDELYDDSSNFLICTPFAELKSKNKLSNIVSKNVSVKSFLNYSIENIKNRLRIDDFYQLNESYLFQENVCFSIKQEDLNDKKTLKKFIFNYDVILFIYSDGKLPFFHEFVYRRNNTINLISLRVHKQKVYNENYLTSDCFYYQDQLRVDRTNCLNNCYKKIEKSNKCFYDSNEDYELNLNLILKNDEQIINNSFKNHSENNDIDLLKGIDKKYEQCLKQCQKTDCSFENHFVLKMQQLNQDRTVGKNLTLSQSIYKPFYSTAYFWLQFLGLFTLFTNTSVVCKMNSF